KLVELWGYFVERVRNVWHTLTRRTWLAQASTRLVSAVSRRPPAKLYLNLMSKRYRPRPYDGRVVLFRRSLRPISRYLDCKLGWGGVITGEFDVVEVRGDHGDMFDEPEVRRTAATLAAHLGDRLRSKSECAERSAMVEVFGQGETGSLVRS